MNKELKEILNKYKEFKDFVEGLDIEIFKKFSREELEELSKALTDNEPKRYLQSELRNIMNEKKLEEYPELLGIHHYPKLKEINFLSEEDKIKLDNLLVTFGNNSFFGAMNYKWFNFINSIDKINGKDTANKILDFLYKEHMIEVFYNIDNCCDMILVSEKQLKDIIKYLNLLAKNEMTNEEYIEIHRLKDSFSYDIIFDEDGIRRCPECEERIEAYLEYYEGYLSCRLNECYCRLIAKRDTTYDNL